MTCESTGSPQCNSWYCEKCKTHVEGIKKLEIYRAPKVLIIHLKRFKNVGYFREKINDPVIFPLKGMDISEFVIGPENTLVYDLYAISNHIGQICHLTFSESRYCGQDREREGEKAKHSPWYRERENLERERMKERKRETKNELPTGPPRCKSPMVSPIRIHACST